MSKNVIINVIIAILCLATIAMLLIPSFTVPTTDGEISENFMGYAAFPSKHKDFGKYLTAQFAEKWNVEYYINDTIHGIVILFLLSIASFILCLVFRNKVGSAIICAFLSVIYLWVAIFNKMLMLSSFRWFFLVAAVIIAALEALNIRLFVQRAKARAIERAKEEIIL